MLLVVPLLPQKPPHHISFTPIAFTPNIFHPFPKNQGYDIAFVSGTGWFEADQCFQIGVSGNNVLRPAMLLPMASNHLSSLGFLQTMGFFSGMGCCRSSGSCSLWLPSVRAPAELWWFVALYFLAEKTFWFHYSNMGLKCNCLNSKVAASHDPPMYL